MLVYESLPELAKKHSGDVYCAMSGTEYTLFLLGTIPSEISGKIDGKGNVQWGSEAVGSKGFARQYDSLMKLVYPREDLASFWANANKNRPCSAQFKVATTEPYWVKVKQDITLSPSDITALNEMTSYALSLPLPDDETEVDFLP
eukprot:TRINITY_DN29896_c0_g1_i1.p1 TRINITY_DN29896_c0_g1~~TRINITY_DN29896_c0_g1_i1.p1  ORF type:complete len:145 (+),score=13.97 TRINITY_DN29896_c0_g1_i1:58-492(+)